MTQQQTNVKRTKLCRYTRGSNKQKKPERDRRKYKGIQVPHRIHDCRGQRASFRRGQLLQWNMRKIDGEIERNSEARENEQNVIAGRVGIQGPHRIHDWRRRRRRGMQQCRWRQQRRRVTAITAVKKARD